MKESLIAIEVEICCVHALKDYSDDQFHCEPASLVGLSMVMYCAPHTNTRTVSTLTIMR